MDNPDEGSLVIPPQLLFDERVQRLLPSIAREFLVARPWQKESWRFIRQHLQLVLLVERDVLESGAVVWRLREQEWIEDMQ
jgi:hypothetical protein